MNLKSINKFLLLFFFSLLYTSFIYYLNFFLLEDYSKYYICSELRTFGINILDLRIDLILPYTCDSEYFLGFRDISEIIKNEFSYQFRPLYFLLVGIVSKVVSLFFIDDSLLIFIFGSLIFHLLIANLSFWLILKSFKEKFNTLTIAFMYFIFLLNPIFKWGIFDPSHQTLTVLNFCLIFYMLRNKNKITNTNIYIFSLIFGILFLLNKIFVLSFIVYSVIKFFQIKNDFVIYFSKTFSLKIFIFYFPTILYKRIIEFFGFVPYDSSTEFWQHFIWVKNFLFGNETSDGTWYCQSIPDNFLCYLEDSVLTLNYLILPIGYLLIKLAILFYFKLVKDSSQILLALIITFMINFSFWSLIGWYPPLRFNLYSFFPAIFVLFLVTFKHSPTRLKYILCSNLAIYLLSLRHWNYPLVIDYNFIFYLNLIIFAIILIFDFKYIKKESSLILNNLFST